MVQNRNSYYNQVKAVPTNELVPIKQDIEKLDEKVTNVEAKVDELSNQVITECVIADNVTVNQKLTADNIETDTVKSNTFTGNSAEIDAIDATTVEADEVKATDASFSNLTVANKVNELSVGTLHTDTFSPTNISTNTVTADTVTADTVNSDDVVTEKLHVTDKATIDNADIETADIMNGDIHSLSSDTITVREITADKTTVTEVDANIVKSTVAEFTRSTIDSIKTHTISTNGKLNADPQGETHYSIDVPNYDNALVQLSGVYSTNDKWSVNILKAKNTAYISASETTLDGILDISYDDGKLRLRVKSDGIVNYSLYVNEENPAPLTISPLGDHYMPYYYVPEKLNTYTLLGYDDSTSQFYIPGTLKVYQLTAEYVSYERLAVVELRADRLELPKTHDSGGGVSEYSYGNARDYVSVSDDELVNEYHTPIEHATNGALSNSTCLIAESAITEYDGSRTVENVTTYPITHLGDSSVVHGKLAVEDDTVIDGTVAIKGDLWVDGTTHTVDEEEVISQADTITLRANNSSSLGSNLSGLVINKYNGTDDLGIVADSDGTLRVGTGTGTETCYQSISYDYVNNKWYTDPEDITTEVTPVGNLTSWASKEKEEPFTTYTDAVFTLFDKTTLEPVMTRDESTDMTDGQIICWDSTGNKAKTTNCISDNVTFAKCVDVECDLHVGNNLNVDSSICACCNVDTGTVNADCVNVCCCIDAKDATFCDSVTICCDLRVCGSAIIHGLTSDCVAVQENTSDHAMYPTFVCRNNAQQQGELMFTDYDLNYNPFTNTLYSPNIEFTTAHGNNVTADIGVTTVQVTANRIMSPNSAGFDTSVEFYQHQNNDTYRKVACLECNTFKYEPFSGDDCCGKMQFMLSDNTTFVDQCNYVQGGFLHTCAIVADDDFSVFCGICTKYDILMYCEDWNSQSGYIYCDGSACWNGEWCFCCDVCFDTCTYMNGPLIVSSNNACNNYDEGIRINVGAGCFSTMTIGTTGDCGISTGFWIGTNCSNAEDRLYVNYHNSNVGSYFQGNSDGTTTWHGNVDGTATNAGLFCNKPTGCFIADAYTGGNIGPNADLTSYHTMTTESGIDGLWRHILNLGWSSETPATDGTWAAQLSIPSNHSSGLHAYIRCHNGSGYNSWCPWVALIDSQGGQRVAGALCIDVICPGVVSGQCGQSRIEYTNASFGGYTIHDNQTCALYIESREQVGSGDSGGVVITNDGATIFGAGDTDGVLRVVNEDNVGAGAVFRVYKDGHTTAIGESHANAFYATRSDGLSLCSSLGGTLWLGQNSIAIGNPVSWSGSNNYVTAIGYNAMGCEISSTAIGGQTVAYNYSFAGGWDARALAHSTVAIGNSAYACGGCSIAIGRETIACKGESVAIGCGARTGDFGGAQVIKNIALGTAYGFGYAEATVIVCANAMKCDVFKAFDSLKCSLHDWDRIHGIGQAMKLATDYRWGNNDTTPSRVTKDSATRWAVFIEGEWHYFDQGDTGTWSYYNCGWLWHGTLSSY